MIALRTSAAMDKTVASAHDHRIHIAALRLLAARIGRRSHPTRQPMSERPRSSSASHEESARRAGRLDPESELGVWQVPEALTPQGSMWCALGAMLDGEGDRRVAMLNGQGPATRDLNRDHAP